MESIRLPADVLFTLGPVPITNAMLSMWLVTLGIIVVAILVRLGMRVVPSRAQIVLEMGIGYFYDALTDAFGTQKRALKYLPFIFTLFLMLAVMNQFSVFPLLTSIVVDGDVNLFRVATSDWSLTLTLALITVIGSQVIAFVAHPIRHIGNYFRFHLFFKVKTPMELFLACIEFALGLLDIISEIAKVISLSARLFGNILAGEVLMIIIVGLTAYTQFILPIPFVILSIFSGFVQAFVFAFLSLQFMSGVITAVDDAPAELETTPDGQTA
ncbi:hypothetical protein COW46_00275 [Candidatus Gracilibacteria bacterium CG17_big_fil_post_rev_8_21_14_2_50_48_13]|nr:MAG: hypothetical protein COW46_00275 [Candidatus Gracilibacteria bacterium CG17_big_fil_post_rev_8_21_14_2_50_48_13]